MGFFTCAGAKNLKKRLYNRQIDQWTDWRIYQLKNRAYAVTCPQLKIPLAALGGWTNKQLSSLQKSKQRLIHIQPSHL